MDYITPLARTRSRQFDSPPFALTGWPLEAAMALDEAGNGFLRSTCRAKQPWRQALASAFAGGLLDHPGLFMERALGRADDQAPWRDQLAAVAELLPTMKPREVVLAGLGICPDGYVGALSKLGHEPLRPKLYLRLLDLFTSSSGIDRDRRRVLEQLTSLREGQLEALDLLDPVLLHPVVCGQIKFEPQAQKLNQILAAIRSCCSSATDDAIRQSLAAFSLSGQTRWTRNWLSKADMGAAPISVEDAEIEVVTPENIARIAEAFNNCLKTMTPRMLAGTWAALVYLPADLILAFTKLDDERWLMTGAYGRSNGFVQEERRAAARDKVQSLGPRFVLPAEPPKELRAITDLVDPFWLERELDDLC